MWLDRFSNTSTSTSTPTSNTPSRYHSPAPQRPGQLSPLQRNGLGIGIGIGISNGNGNGNSPGPPRSASNASLDLPSSPASSNASLPLPQRRLTGSALRQEQRPPPDVADPTVTLSRLLGPQRLSNSHQHQPTHAERDGSIDSIDSIEFGDLTLEEFVRQDNAAEPPGHPTLHHVGRSKSERRNYHLFHTSIAQADHVLKSLESYLTDFKAELGHVSAEIESLQARSVLLNTQLDNRRRVEKRLGPAVEDISLSPATVRVIAEGPIDENFARALTEIEARHLSLTENVKHINSAKAAEDTKPLLHDLQARAVERIRDYLVAQIKSLRSPNINAQVLQQQSLLKHKELYPFLSRSNPNLADDIARAYVNTMRWYYNTNFIRYKTALTKLPLHSADQNDLLGSDPATRRPNVLGATKPSPVQHDPFGLGRRADYLKSNDNRALPSHLAEDTKTTSYLEVPFRNFNQVLLDNLTAEYSLVTELFSTSSYHQVSRCVSDIFEPTFILGHGLTKQLVENTTDCLGILVCIRLTQQYAFEAQKRKLPVMDDYINYTNILLWPRFQKAMDLHIESLKKVPITVNRGAAAAFSLVGGSANSPNTVAPHAVTQRFGQLTHGILTLSATAGDDEPLAHSLSRLRAEYEALMGKISKAAGDVSKRGRFLYNNYSLVLTIISDTEGKLAEEQKEYFGNLVRDFKIK